MRDPSTESGDRKSHGVDEVRDLTPTGERCTTSPEETSRDPPRAVRACNQGGAPEAVEWRAREGEVRKRPNENGEERLRGGEEGNVRARVEGLETGARRKRVGGELKGLRRAMGAGEG
ncbi:hypothetical protein Nepgr_024075 [Nepenthes gracilis]|uniref:Uncharacterized protein n=1 Tax=Nepenthes gracilis TaxID=150966 RepID=A0AAD3T589_NEPGR|nr:hypothetical protein Nepgr_024075 [Nepenthes gracilis]